jgi:hypothetical protein
LPIASELRSESPSFTHLNDEQNQALLSKASELGFGSGEGVGLSQQGLFGANVIIEGGQSHKIMAEATMVIAELEVARPSSITFAASPNRLITNSDEVASTDRLLGVSQNDKRTEYSVACEIINNLPGFNQRLEPTVLDFGYDVATGFSVKADATGQFQVLGDVQGIPIVLMSIDRQDLEDGKYIQPRTDDVISIIDGVLKLQNADKLPIAYVTSGTYRPSRAVSVALAGLSADRPVGLATYGNNLLNSIKGTDLPPPLGQLPSELNVMATELAKLKKALGASE